MRLFIRGIEYVIIVFMGIIVFFVIAETALRGLAGVSLIITDELSRYLMIWTAMLAAALLVQEDGHLQISLLTGRVGPRGRAILYFCAQFVVLAFLAMLIFSSARRLPSMVPQNTVTLGISMAWFYAALPVSGVLMFIFAVGNIIARLRAPEAPRDPSVPVQPDSPI